MSQERYNRKCERVEVQEMAVPARRTSKAKKNKRRTHKGLSVPGLQFDKETGEYRMSHRISPDGTYGGKQII